MTGNISFASSQVTQSGTSTFFSMRYNGKLISKDTRRTSAIIPCTSRVKPAQRWLTVSHQRLRARFMVRLMGSPRSAAKAKAAVGALPPQANRKRRKAKGTGRPSPLGEAKVRAQQLMGMLPHL